MVSRVVVVAGCRSKWKSQDVQRTFLERKKGANGSFWIPRLLSFVTLLTSLAACRAEWFCRAQGLWLSFPAFMTALFSFGCFLGMHFAAVGRLQVVCGTYLAQNVFAGSMQGQGDVVAAYDLSLGASTDGTRG
eukprot:TRINITY_DN12289_c0_g1_i1.p3 TRINITY_DN12289_c0_g1~~TRINITY_DN12289_c0_g1_i1.p3  ORF type:complete len:133 (-),score=9.35 TRINITY_DN12289_c0_g1_i1:103-501(-)